jgi:hypothetical protein
MRISSLRQPGCPFSKGPVALRHQITLVLPVRRTFLNFRSNRSTPRALLSSKVLQTIKKEHSYYPKIRVLLESVTYRGAKMQSLISSATRPSFAKDPWLCVTRLLWFCPFGERIHSLSMNRMWTFYQMLQAIATVIFAWAEYFFLYIAAPFLSYFIPAVNPPV